MRMYIHDVVAFRNFANAPKNAMDNSVLLWLTHYPQMQIPHYV
jgi:hypothetical protein